MSSSAVPGQPAIDDVWVRPALRRKRLDGVRLVALGVLMLGTVAVVTHHYSSQSSALLRSGGQVRGVVTSVHSGSARSGAIAVSYQVAGHSYVETLTLAGDVRTYHQGDAVTVHFDRSDPSRMTIDGQVNQPGWTVLPLIVLFLGGVGAAGSGVALVVLWRRHEHLLRRLPWQVVTATVTSQALGPFGSADVTSADGTLRAHLNTPWRASSGVEELRVVADGRVVVLARGDAELRLARVPRMLRPVREP